MLASCAAADVGLHTAAGRVRASGWQEIFRPGLHQEPNRRPSAEATAQLRAASKKVNAGLVMLKVRRGIPGGKFDTYQATGLVISKSHRLVVTAAHIADWFSMQYELLAVVDGTAQVHRVERVWYHPRVVRELDFGFLVRSDDFRDGGPTACPDMAVVQLAADGRDLPGQVELASDEELRDLEGKAIGFVAYPVSAGTQWPTKSRPARSTFSCCLVGAMKHLTWRTDRDEGVPIGKRERLYFDFDLGRCERLPDLSAKRACCGHRYKRRRVN